MQISAHFPEREADKAAIKSTFLLCVAGGIGMLPIRQRITVFLILGFLYVGKAVEWREEPRYTRSSAARLCWS